MSDKKFSIRFAAVEDIPTIMRFIKELAVYESLEHELNLTEESLKENIFDKKKAEVIIAFEDDIPVGHAVFFETFSTFVGRHGLYLDDLYVNEKLYSSVLVYFYVNNLDRCLSNDLMLEERTVV